ncbi:hypothetical protein [Mesorhizobium hawassense]|uniref:hypothetical protein n=1 Tax=Mesorhizobium hawassense TaxID=1209954 RepID=UPI00142DA45D|nr:hypothetical protein [Mesorhizobium hawassense]
MTTTATPRRPTAASSTSGSCDGWETCSQTMPIWISKSRAKRRTSATGATVASRTVVGYVCFWLPQK